MSYTYYPAYDPSGIGYTHNLYNLLAVANAYAPMWGQTVDQWMASSGYYQNDPGAAPAPSAPPSPTPTPSAPPPAPTPPPSTGGSPSSAPAPTAPAPTAPAPA